MIASSQRWHLAFAAAGAGAWEWDLRTNRVSWSTSLEALHGLRSGSFPGTVEASHAFLHPEDRLRVVSELEHEVEGRAEVAQLEYRILRLDGGIRWVESRNRVVVDDGGAPAYLLGLCFDVTDTASVRACAEDFARSTRDALGTVADHHPDGLFIRRGETILFANDAFARMAGFGDGSALVGLSLTGLIAPEERGMLKDQLRAADEGGRHGPVQLWLLRADGQRQSVELRQGSTGELRGGPCTVVAVRPLDDTHQGALAGAAHQLEDRILVARELLDRAIVRVATGSTRDLTRRTLEDLSAELGELHLSACDLAGKLR